MVAASAFATGITLGNLVAFAEWVIGRAATAMDGMVPAARVALPGLDVSLYSQNSGYVQLARERLSEAGAALGRNQPCRILVTSAGVDNLMVPPEWGDEVFHSRRFEKTLEHTSFRAEFDHALRFWQILDLERNIGVQWMQSDRAYPPWEPGSPLRVFLHWFYSARGLRLAHAGTLGRKGKGVMLVGRGGSGKSGTVVDGVLSGMQTVGDDYVLLDRGRDFPQAYPIFRTFKQDRDGLRRLGLSEAIMAGREPNWQGKYEFFSEDLDGARMTPSLEIRALLVPFVAHTAQSQLTAVSQARAMLALAPSGLFQMPGDRDSGVARFAELVRSLPCFGLALGWERKEVSRVVGDLLDRLQ